jgi:hypothetical protein
MLYSKWWWTQMCCIHFWGKKTWDVSFIAWKGLKELAAPVLYCIIKICWKTDLNLLPVGFSYSVKKSIFFNKLCNALQHVCSTIKCLGVYEIKNSECVRGIEPTLLICVAMWSKNPETHMVGLDLAQGLSWLPCVGIGLLLIRSPNPWRHKTCQSNNQHKHCF